MVKLNRSQSKTKVMNLGKGQVVRLPEVGRRQETVLVASNQSALYTCVKLSKTSPITNNYSEPTLFVSNLLFWYMGFNLGLVYTRQTLYHWVVRPVHFLNQFYKLHRLSLNSFSNFWPSYLDLTSSWNHQSIRSDSSLNIFLNGISEFKGQIQCLSYFLI